MLNVEFQSDKIITSPNIQVEDGSFAIDDAPLIFDHCRERFGKKFNELTAGFFFKHSADKGQDIAGFLIKTEIILKQNDFSKFSKTNRNTILWVQPSGFWKSCRMKRSLFTIMLRAGVFYDLQQDNYEGALFAENYISVTRTAVMRFLYGFTDYVGPLANDHQSSLETMGWKATFDKIDDNLVKRYLISPNNKPLKTELSSQALWA